MTYEPKEIGGFWMAHGVDILVVEHQGKFYWTLYLDDTVLSESFDFEDGWEEIPESLYKELIAFEYQRLKDE